MPGTPDYRVEIVDGDGEPDMSVAIVGDQVIDLEGASDGDVVTVQADGTLAPEAPSGGGGAPSGPAGGVLGGTYPDPSFAVDMATQAELDAHVSDSADAHDASAISFDPTAGIPETDVQAAIAGLEAGKLLAIKRFIPGSDQNYTTTSGTLVDVDATNAVLTFDAPESGIVELWVQVPKAAISNAARSAMWGWREGTTQVGGKEPGVTGTTADVASVAVSCIASGLTPGQSYTLKLAHHSSDGTATATMRAGPNHGGLIMKAIAVATLQ